MKRTNILIIVIFGFVVLMMALIQFIEHLSVTRFSYWLILIFSSILCWGFHLKSIFTLFTAFIFFILSSLLTTVNLSGIGEILMRLSLIYWILGITQALIEYKKVKRVIMD